MAYTDYTVFKFKMFFGDDYKAEDAQERYVIAKTEDEAIAKFHDYLEYLASNGFQSPRTYSDYPTIEIYYAIG